MEYIHATIDSALLAGIFNLPFSLQNIKVEVIEPVPKLIDCAFTFPA
jgi:hypothetical protein